MTEIQRLLEADEDIVTYNVERSALQMHCEEGAIVASLPVEGELASTAYAWQQHRAQELRAAE